jgi:hypothetical protein
VSIPSKLKKWKRRRIAGKFPETDSPEREKKRKAIETIFIEHGLPGLTRAQRLLNDEEALKKEMTARKQFYGGSVALDVTAEDLVEIRRHSTMRVPDSVSPLLSAKLISLKRGELTVDADVKPLLSDFIAQVSGEDDNLVEPPAG